MLTAKQLWLSQSSGSRELSTCLAVAISPLSRFHCLCSILNKLTPEKFDKLCLELLNVGVDSKLVLKGVILLVSSPFASRENPKSIQ